jgi:hypothetical protein
MVVFQVSVQTSEVTLWWNGSDDATQTSLAYTNLYFTDNPSGGTLNNGKITLSFSGGFTVRSTVGSTATLSTANFMRLNSEDSVYGAGEAYVIHHGVVRDIVQQEAEWGGDGAPNCPNLYANIVLTLPAGVTYYTYQLRLMFINSTQPRTITDLCPIRLSTSLNPVQAMTENGTTSGFPMVTNGTGIFHNSAGGGYVAHQWSQFISGSRGAGIMFTSTANQRLYAFDSVAGNPTGALRTDAGSNELLELLPVTPSAPVQFTYPLDITWQGAVVTFDNTMPIYTSQGGVPTGLWILVEYPPEFTVIAED